MENILVFNDELIFDVFPDGEAVIYDDKNEKTHILNESALMAYNACIGFTLQQAQENYLKNFDLSEKIIRFKDDMCENDSAEAMCLHEQSPEDEVSRDEILLDFMRIVEMFLDNEILYYAEGPK